MDLWKKMGLWDAGKWRDLLGFSTGFSLQSLWLDSSLCRTSVERIFCLLLFPCWKKKGSKSFGNSFPPGCFGLQNPGDFLAGGAWRKKIYGILDPWFVMNHRVGEAGLEVWKRKLQKQGNFPFSRSKKILQDLEYLPHRQNS